MVYPAPRTTSVFRWVSESISSTTFNRMPREAVKRSTISRRPWVRCGRISPNSAQAASVIDARLPIDRDFMGPAICPGHQEEILDQQGRKPQVTCLVAIVENTEINRSLAQPLLDVPTHGVHDRSRIEETAVGRLPRVEPIKCCKLNSEN